MALYSFGIFPAQAMLIGNQHFMTFDKRFYDFVGKCQYVLANDFADQNFSVIVNYNDGDQANERYPKKQSIVVVSDFHHVEIRSDLKVKYRQVSKKRKQDQAPVRDYLLSSRRYEATMIRVTSIKSDS